MYDYGDERKNRLAFVARSKARVVWQQHRVRLVMHPWSPRHGAPPLKDREGTVVDIGEVRCYMRTRDGGEFSCPWWHIAEVQPIGRRYV